MPHTRSLPVQYCKNNRAFFDVGTFSFIGFKEQVRPNECVKFAIRFLEVEKGYLYVTVEC